MSSPFQSLTAAVVVTSGPSSAYPKRAYRNPTDTLVKFLDYKHGENWAVWEFRAEGTGYPDSEVYGRVRHYPWPDHHPPPFALVPNIMASMRNWLKEEKPKDKNPMYTKNVVVVHCKAGKGRSGTVVCSYLISEEGWKIEDALTRFTKRRMRPNFGDGVSIPSQLRWVRYVDRWSKTGKNYIEQPAEVVEIHVWGLREGVKISVEGYVEEGRKIHVFHTYSKTERLIVDETVNHIPMAGTAEQSAIACAPASVQTTGTHGSPSLINKNQVASPKANLERQGTEKGGKAVIFRSASPIILPSSDICVDVERRNRARYGWTMVTAVAHVWFNTFFESGLPETLNPSKSPSDKKPDESSNGIFEISWDAMDGLKGSSRKGTRAFDRMAVVWRIPKDNTTGQAKPIKEPAPGEEVPQSEPADWSGNGGKHTGPNDTLGLRVQSSLSGEDISQASSIKSRSQQGQLAHVGSQESLNVVKSYP